jgi:hypothetical protein
MRDRGQRRHERGRSQPAGAREKAPASLRPRLLAATPVTIERAHSDFRHLLLRDKKKKPTSADQRASWASLPCARTAVGASFDQIW